MNTEIVVVRCAFNAKAVTGIYVVDGAPWAAYSLEDCLRAPGVKVHGQTCIDAGRYKLDKRESPHLKREVIWIQDVPRFDYSYIHALNDATETDGCIGIAHFRNEARDRIFGDALVLERRLFDYIEARGWPGAWITIIDGPGAEEWKT